MCKKTSTTHLLGKPSYVTRSSPLLSFSRPVSLFLLYTMLALDLCGRQIQKCMPQNGYYFMYADGLGLGLRFGLVSQDIIIGIHEVLTHKMQQYLPLRTHNIIIIIVSLFEL
jgi:hypothetical protein